MGLGAGHQPGGHPPVASSVGPRGQRFGAEVMSSIPCSSVLRRQVIEDKSCGRRLGSVMKRPVSGQGGQCSQSGR